MPTPPPTPTPAPTPAPGSSDAKYLLVVAGLMMTIVILLSVLWIRERRNVAHYQNQLQIAHQNSIRSDQQAALASMLAGKIESRARALQRDDLPAEVITWNGQPRTVLRVSAAAGQRLGLWPGDVIVVASPPATEPATQPATTTATQPSTRPGA
jgi:hypothetical protein